MKLSCTRTRLTVAVVMLGLVLCAAAGVHCEVLINEVIADNRSTGPLDIGGGTPDMIELYNSSDEAVVLGAVEDENSYYLSDGCAESNFGTDCLFPKDASGAAGAWRFPVGTVIQPKGYLVVFCDRNPDEGKCELHASFEIASNGEEPIILWGPEDAGEHPIAGRVWLPPLARDVSFARRTDMLASAIPTLKNRSGKAFPKVAVFVDFDRSPSKTIMSLLVFPISASALPYASRVATPIFFSIAIP